MRLFVAIPMAEAVRGELAALTARLKSRNDGLRWTAPEAWHITLVFLGNTSPDQYECVAARLGELHLPPVPIALEKVDIFARGGVLIATVRPAPQLLQLQQRVSAAAALCGYVPEARPYQPHITLARSKGRGPELTALKAKIQRQSAFTSFVAGEFLLYESYLESGGSRYEIRRRFPLVTRNAA
jgi:2'-5' RNA ligase